MASYVPVKLAYYIAEPENGADTNLSPIIFLHGLTASKKLWSNIPQIVANKTKRKTYVVDQRNHGETEWSDIFNFDVLVDDLLHFMDTNGIPKAILIGHSMGGIVGISAALKKPHKVEALVVEDMTVGRLPKEAVGMIKDLISKSHELVQQVSPDVDEKQVYEILMKGMMKILPESRIQSLKKRYESNDILGHIRKNENGVWDFRANYTVIKKALSDASTLMSEHEGVYQGPTSFVYGTESYVPVKLNEPRIKQHFSNVEMVPIEGASHDITGDCPEELTKAFLDFLLKLK